MTFTQECAELLKHINCDSGDMARLAHRLSQAINRLDAVVDQANAQFKAGDRHATFNKQTIEALNEPLLARRPDTERYAPTVSEYAGRRNNVQG